MAAGNQWKHLEFTLALSKRFYFHFIASITYYNVNYLSPITNLLIQKQVMRESIEKQKMRFILFVKLENMISQHIGYSELEDIRGIDIFVHVTCYPETMPMSHTVKQLCSIFKTKRSTELKIYALK